MGSSWTRVELSLASPSTTAARQALASACAHSACRPPQVGPLLGCSLRPGFLLHPVLTADAAKRDYLAHIADSGGRGSRGLSPARPRGVGVGAACHSSRAPERWNSSLGHSVRQASVGLDGVEGALLDRDAGLWIAAGLVILRGVGAARGPTSRSCSSPARSGRGRSRSGASAPSRSACTAETDYHWRVMWGPRVRWLPSTTRASRLLRSWPQSGQRPCTRQCCHHRYRGGHRWSPTRQPSRAEG